MTPGPAVLRDRVWLLGAAAFCIYEALPRSLTTLSQISKSVHERDPMLIFWFIVAIVFMVLIATRSSFVTDRVVFGAAAGGLGLRLIALVVLPSPFATSVIDGFRSLSWTIGAVGALMALISRQRSGI